jgi:hypothetical protein
MIPQMIKNFVANIVFAYALAVIIMLAATSTLSPGAGISTGICMAIIVWLGFIVTATSIDVIWMGKSYKLWLYEAFCSLVSLVAMGAIIAAW